MTKMIIFRDGVFYDDRWNAIDPTFEELTEITEAVNKYATIKIKEVTS